VPQKFTVLGVTIRLVESAELSDGELDSELDLGDCVLWIRPGASQYIREEAIANARSVCLLRPDLLPLPPTDVPA
jgi:hypothetical protein